MFKFIRILVLPLVVVSRVVHNACPSVHPHTVKITMGIFIAFSGAYMATNPVAVVPHFIWDGVAYSLHGYGILPLIHVMRKHLIDLELEDESRPIVKKNSQEIDFSI